MEGIAGSIGLSRRIPKTTVFQKRSPKNGDSVHFLLGVCSRDGKGRNCSITIADIDTEARSGAKCKKSTITKDDSGAQKKLAELGEASRGRIAQGEAREFE